MITDAIQFVDTRLLNLAASLRTPFLDSFFLRSTWLGSLWVLAPIALLWSLRQRRRQSALPIWLGPAALVSTSAVVYSLKELVERPRPALHQSLATLPIDSSFPSAHAAQAAALAIGLGWHAGQPTRTVLVGAVLVVACSRPYLQVHYPSDVLAGLLIGVACALTTARFLREAGK